MLHGIGEMSGLQAHRKKVRSSKEVVVVDLISTLPIDIIHNIFKYLSAHERRVALS